MRLAWSLCLVGLSGVAALAQTTPDVGVGATNSFFKAQFVYAWGRNGFNRLVGDPLGFVTNYGSTGLIQQFPSVAKPSSTLVLIKPDTSGGFNVFQIQAAMYTYYNTVSQANAGYPSDDTLNCPALLSPSNTSNSCQWQPFANNYALFVYAQELPSRSQNFATRDPYYTKWVTFGGIAGLGPANSAETKVTSQFSSQATVQTFDQGAIYSITSGLFSGRFAAVKEPVYDVYVSNGAHAGSLGLPVTEELVLINGLRQQTFEGGAIQYDPATGVAVLRPPISSLSLVPVGSIHLNLGDTIAAQVTVSSAYGAVLTDRTVSWNTSNGQVVKIQSSGLTATLKAVGAGTANVTVSSEGKISLPLTISVTAPCCQIGEGAPTASIQQAFQDAVTRNKLSVLVPAASAATRVGNGFAQQLLSTGATPVPYLVAVPDGAVTGYVVAGAILSQYLALGGPAGALGYPLSDATSGGRQTFRQGTLAGNPVQLVTGAILSKWATLGYETGVAGSPTALAATFLTFRGASGNMQSFQNALILAPAGQAYFVSGPVLDKYNSSGGPGGDLGAPTDDEHAINGLRQQDFEGGYVSYAPGASLASVFKSPRQPLVSATPSSVLSGTAVHLVAGGFNNGATVRVSQSGQPDFVVTVANGVYAWDVHVPAAAPNGTVTIKAADVNGTVAAQGSYTVRSASSAPLTISVVSGDQQNGAPGAQLAEPLVVVVRDQSGNPAPGQAVTFAASPGAQVVPASATTGAGGQASAMLRMPMTAGVALATAQAGHQVVTFSAKSEAFSLANFPALTQAIDGALGNGSDTIRQKGALLTAVASILRYYQALGQLPQPTGLADPAILNQFLKSFCIFDSQGSKICDGFASLGSGTEQTVNLWRVGAFVANGIDVRVEQTSLNAVRDLVASGSPVLLALSMNGRGSHFVSATGIAADGSLVIVDPAGGGTSTLGNIQGALSGAVRLLPQAPSSTGFLVTASAPATVSSATGACGQTLQFPDTAAVAGATPASPPGTLYFRACDGSAGPYELDIAAQGPYNGTFTELSANGGRAVLAGSAAQVIRNGQHWTVAPLAVNLVPAGVVNAASFTGELAPGGLISVFGSGFAVGASVQVNGEPAYVVASTPFLVNAQIPFDISPGTATLSVSSGTGSAQQSVQVSNVAPAIFSTAAGQAAITNQDNTLNTPSNPAARGGAIVVYGTGFGAVSPAGALRTANTPVSVVIGGIEIPTAFAGLTPGLVGLYQANVLLPSALPPGLALPLYLKQGAATSNTVTVAIQ